MKPEESLINDLRDQIAYLKDSLAAQQRECDILRGTPAARISTSTVRHMAAPSRHVPHLENAVERLDDFVRELAGDDCYGSDYGGDYGGEADKCDCRPCRAVLVLKEVYDWRFGGSVEQPSRRFEGAMFRRTETGWNPRETKIHRAWTREMGRQDADRYLGAILSNDHQSGNGSSASIDWPTARDWYVATSVVQWLATNCGMAVLEGAGFEYMHYAEDRDSIDAMRAVSE